MPKLTKKIMSQLKNNSTPKTLVITGVHVFRKNPFQNNNSTHEVKLSGKMSIKECSKIIAALNKKSVEKIILGDLDYHVKEAIKKLEISIPIIDSPSIQKAEEPAPVASPIIHEDNVNKLYKENEKGIAIWNQYAKAGYIDDALKRRALEKINVFIKCCDFKIHHTNKKNIHEIIEIWLKKANVLIMTRNFVEAEKCLIELLSSARTHLTGIALLARTYALQGKTEKALKEMQKAFNLDSLDYSNRLEYAKQLSNNGLYSDAIHVLEAISDSPDKMIGVLNFPARYKNTSDVLVMKYETLAAIHKKLNHSEQYAECKKKEDFFYQKAIAEGYVFDYLPANPLPKAANNNERNYIIKAVNPEMISNSLGKTLLFGKHYDEVKHHVYSKPTLPRRGSFSGQPSDALRLFKSNVKVEKSNSNETKPLFVNTSSESRVDDNAKSPIVNWVGF